MMLFKDAPPGPDRRLAELDAALRVLEAKAPFGSDEPRRDSLRHGLPVSGIPSIHIGYITLAVPSRNYYIVRAGTAGILPAQRITNESQRPFGARSVEGLQVDSRVLVLSVPDLPYAIILGVASEDGESSRISPSILTPGSFGPEFDDIVRTLYADPRYADDSFGAARPLDAGSLEKTIHAATGCRITVDELGFELAIDETTGVFGSYIDGLLRLAGRHYFAESAIHEERVCSDEGDAEYFRGIAAYPHEALGMRRPGTPHGREFDAAEVAAGRSAAFDVPEDLDARPFYRWREYAGFDRGFMRELATPVGETAERSLYQEIVGRRGDLHVASARSLTLSRRGRLTELRRLHDVDDPRGDDRRRDETAFGRVADIDYPVPAEESHLYRAFGGPEIVDEIYRRQFENRRNRRDWVVNDAPLPAIEPPRGDEPHLPAPTSETVETPDDSVRIAELLQFISLTEDGGIAIGDAHGSRIVLSGGKIRLSAALDIELHVGRLLVALGKEIVLKAGGDIDVSSAAGDVRIKGDTLRQLGETGVLIESHGVETRQGLEGIDDVNGVVLKSAGSVAAIASSASFNIDNEFSVASRGPLHLDGLTTRLSGESRVDLAIRSGEPENWVRTIVSSSFVSVPQDLLVGGDVRAFGENSSLELTGRVTAGGGGTFGGALASGDGRQPSLASEEFRDRFRETMTGSAASLQEFVDGIAETDRREVEAASAAGSPLAADASQSVAFAFRNPEAYTPFRWIACGWEVVATDRWDETPVETPNGPSWPWPGLPAMQQANYWTPSPGGVWRKAPFTSVPGTA